MSSVFVPFVRQWHVRLPILGRELERRYVDEFFLDGSMRLSSFEAFHRHPNEARRDDREGTVAMQVNAPNGQMAILGGNGQEAYVLSASTARAPRAPAGSERTTFLIRDTLGFAAAISRQIPGFVGGCEGVCMYSDEAIHSVDHNSLTPEPPPGQNVGQWFDQLNQRVGQLAVQGYFVKPQRFMHECEYRFIWFAEGAPNEYLHLRCPAARQFCERVPDLGADAFQDFQ